MRTSFAILRTVPAVLPIAVIVVAACNSGGIAGADQIVGVDYRSQSVSVGVGERVEVTLGNVGPATFDTMPDISSSAVALIGVDIVPPFNPGGPMQRFSFRAAQRGQAVVDFRRTLNGGSVWVVEDTIIVR